MLSGGYQVRLNLAKILVSEPNLLLLDEPTNYLDIVSIRWLIQFLRAWKNEIILVTHDRAFMDSVTTHTMGIHRKKIRKVAGDTEKLYQQIIQEEEIYEKTRINDERKRGEIEQFINRFRAQASRAKAVQSKIRMLEKHEKKGKLTEERSLDFAFKAAPFPGKWLVEIDDLSFSFSEEGPPIIDGLRMAVKKKDRIAVIGKNGKGQNNTPQAHCRRTFTPSGDRAAKPESHDRLFRSDEYRPSRPGQDRVGRGFERPHRVCPRKRQGHLRRHAL